jgi:UDP-GlcNAc:undecaprenyl-phosphate GlcNAc-1-phosphate transferase
VTPVLVGLGLMLASFALSAILCAIVRVIAPRFGLVDRPGGRKAHKRPTPLGGGVAIWATMVMMLGLGAWAIGPGRGLLPAELALHASGLREKGLAMAGLMGLATLIMVMGLLDDRVGLGWKFRLGVQVALSAVVAASGFRVTLFWPFDHVLISYGITILWIVGLTNAFNFLDNMDGLAAGVGLIAALLFAVAQIDVASLFVPAALLILAGSLGGFLVHNRNPARLFMGDAGSNFLGFLLGVLTVVGTFTRPELGFSPYGVLTPLLVMAVPLYDTTSVILIRLREGRSPFEADRRHFSHRLVDRGLTPRRAVLTIDLVTLACGLGSLLLPRLEPGWAPVVLAQTLALLGVVALLEVSPIRPEHRDGEARRSSPEGPEGRPHLPPIERAGSGG